ncbi:transcriptional regulator [Bradyrhizobium ottawaense]|uniref:helix-turn-helix domain-containing protein n=1 Tax=Bradyrhizobium TaxID=374 RepID=UPI000BE9B05C|nr:MULTISPECIES: helix-turn-helix transcriptional regulator [Bradyrhizobium]MDA9538825.1 XRE family transcriptional regulator [Bradyrhizobium sp. CCBAU 21362]PDT65789.1 transcriptional regulator [Bradyrhizobium ottawaense]
MDIRKLVGRNFTRLRKQKGFTQEKFAEASGFTQQYISGLERGRRNPTVVTLFELASTLGVSHVDLILPDEEFTRRTKAPKRKS